MKIISLRAENFKRLKAVDITPVDENTVVIAGKNAQGKSSVLDAIWAALAGKDGVKQVSRPIRDGETKARVVLELDDLRVERKWSPSGSTLTVGPRDGSAKFSSPQSILDKLIGALSFDPLAFAQADAKSQRDTLVAVLGIGDAIADLEAKRKEAYEERTVVNRQAKAALTRLQALPEVDDDVQPVDVAQLVGELQALTQAKDRREALLDEHARIAQEVRELELKITSLQERSAQVVEEGRRLAPVAADQLAALNQQIAEADERNKLAAQRDERERLVDEHGSLSGEAFDLSEAIAAIDEQKAELIKSSPLPVEGLSFDDEGVLYNGVPFQQASAAERLRVSVAMAMAMNPKVRVICIKDASLLDEDSFAMLTDMAREHDFQVWYEQVGTDGGPVGVVIEDGEVK